MKQFRITNILFFLFFLDGCYFHSGNSNIKNANTSIKSNPLPAVPDSTTAIKIAVATWLPIYGQKIYDEKPFEAELQGDSVWVVQGMGNDSSSVKVVNGQTVIHVVSGGTAYIQIRKIDGKVLEVGHGK